MKTKLLNLALHCAMLLTYCIQAQPVVNVGSGSYAQSPPDVVWDEGAYFGKTYRELADGWPWHIHVNKQSEPIPTNDWWTGTIFEQYTGNLEVFPQRVEGTSNGIKVSVPTSYAMFDARGLSVTMGTSVTVKGAVELSQNGDTEIFEDFETESYPAGWTVTANPPYAGPVSLADFTQSPTPSGFLGDRFINSYNGDGPQMTLTSPNFTIDKNYIHFVMGGGNDIDLNYVGLYINGTRVMAATGENSAALTWKRFDVSAYQGQTAQIRIVDISSGGWGFTMCDNIVFSNEPEVSSAFSNSFWPQDAKAYDWSDLGFVFRLEDDQGHMMDGSVYHGVPFTFIDLKEVDPIIEASSSPTLEYNGAGGVIGGFPYNGNTVVLEVDGELFGLHAPVGSSFDKSPAGNYIPNIPAGAPQYLVISVIPNHSLIGTFDTRARNKIQGSTFGWNYDVSGGEIETTFSFETVNYESGAINQETLLAMQPHHYRGTTGHSFIGGADYQTMFGVMHTMATRDVTLTYEFGGLVPYMPAPTNLNATQQQLLNDLISAKVSVSEDYNGNTYAKGFGEESNVMFMAKELGHPGYETIKTNLKNELINWLTYESGEASTGSYFFAEYPQFGALIGFPVGFGSQAFNDLHFHYGYFITGAARLMMVDEDFKNQYGEMVKRIAKSYANWKRFGINDSDKQPFLRNFDPYAGHSWAGGIGSGVDGNNQESTSEAMHSWFGLYLLGVALEDQEILSLGATGFMLEGITTASYWFDRHGDMPDEYLFDYVGILKANNMAMATFFDGDPAWAFGIQVVPCDFWYSYYLGTDEAGAASDFSAMLQDRVSFGEFPNTDPYANIAEMGAYLGNYHLNYVQSYDPGYAATMLDQLIDQEGGDWATHVNSATNYYVANAGVTYGRPAPGYHTDAPTGGVFVNESGALTTLIYNHTGQIQNFNVYQNGTVIQTVTVGPKQYYNSNGGNQSPIVNAGNDLSITLPTNSVNLTGSASDTDGSIVSLTWTQISGGSANIDTPNAAYTSVSGLTEGNYVFRLTATDDQGANGFDEASVMVESEPQGCGGANLALNKPAVSSSQQGDFAAGNAFDADGGTRWGSDFNDDEWIRVDLEGIYNICQVTLQWEGAFGSDYEIRLGSSTDLSASTVIATVNGGDGGEDIVTTNAAPSGRYLWMRGLARGTGWGYSLWEMEVFGGSGTPQNTAPTANAGADQNLAAGTTSANLSGSGADADGDAITYSWSQTAGPVVTIASPASANTAVSGLASGQSYTFQLITHDGQENSDPDQVTITVADDPQGCGTTNIALNKPAVASTQEGDYGAPNAFDGNGGTRWGSAFNDDEWIRVDLEGTFNICQVTLQWEGAYGSDYEIRLGASTDLNAATVIATVNGGNGGEDTVQTDASASGRYLWMRGLARGTGWGYSLWEMQVFAGSSTPVNTVPVAYAGTDQNHAAGTTSTVLNGSGSDADGDLLTYSWSQVAGPAANISDVNAQSPTVSGLVNGASYTFHLVVNDGTENSVADEVVVTIDEAVVDCNTNVALDQPAVSSSQEGGFAAANAFDGIAGSRWASNYNDDEWIRVDLGAVHAVCSVVLTWETAYGSAYEIRIGNSTDLNASSVIATVSNGDGGIDDVTTDQNVTGRYIWMRGIARGTGWGYSLYEMEAYGSATGARIGGVDSQSHVELVNRLSVYPNPASDRITVHVDGQIEQSGTLEIISITGQVVLLQKAKSGNNDINISHLKDGVFIMRYNGDQINQIKFIRH